MKIIITERQQKLLVESRNEKIKQFLKKTLGVDFTNNIQLITSRFDVPSIFIGECISTYSLNKYLNFWGPMYLFEFEGVKYLYQDRGDEDSRFEWFMDENCNEFVDDEIPEKLGISIAGLKFSDVINSFFDEEN